MTKSEPIADPTPTASRLSVPMVLSAFLAVLITMICVDAMAGALVLALLEFARAVRAVVLWTEGGLLLLSLIPAIWLFRQALAAERRMAEGTYGED